MATIWGMSRRNPPLGTEPFYRRYRPGSKDAAPGRQRARGDRNRWLWPLATIAAAALILGAGYWFALGPGRPGGEAGSTLAALSGEGNAVSEHFIARRGWSIEWENTGSYFSYTIHGEVEFGQVITQNGPGNGITSPVPTGTFFVEVVAQGPWSLKVIQGD